ncbi:xylose isomerase-like protein [Syncephalis pseudoplumigaleata]|uniref:Xylose isomerase-like protein n=1 Tax=Syncephalis pseudoplumigaleata TaxID=1712513 RepID=A0A4P9YV16_9FUNG|nr:xylose isomerase-like protein [Syncephalis pseudoplumigaleata]|eukprot:RKP23628.1 xylose isomerase-like protein [Syncephalis pseudoplumigaleata]
MNLNRRVATTRPSSGRRDGGVVVVVGCSERVIRMTSTLRHQKHKVTKFIGAHTSAAGGVHNAIRWGQTIGPRGSYTSPPLTVEEIAEFKRLREQADYPYIMPHGTYLVNLGNPNIEKRRRFYRTFLDELQRCDLLGIDRYNFQLNGGRMYEERIDRLHSRVHQ